jgi:hypothetical protein
MWRGIPGCVMLMIVARPASNRKGRDKLTNPNSKKKEEKEEEEEERAKERKKHTGVANDRSSAKGSAFGSFALCLSRVFCNQQSP